MKPIMKCGHAANSIIDTNKPACAICLGSDAIEVNDNPPNLSSRKARCTYYGGSGGRNNEGPCRGNKCLCEKPSSPELAFFENQQGDFDRFYCGCFSWD